MEQTTDKVENYDFNKFMKWSKLCIITAIIIGAFGIIPALLTILKEFTDLNVKAPFLYGKIFMGILLAIFLALVTFEIFCYIKARKYKKLIEKSESEE